MEKSHLASSVAMVLTAGMSTSASAELLNYSVLNFDTGSVTCISSCSANYGGIAGVSSGSYFGMDADGDGSISVIERTAISQYNGLIVGTTQDASGSHTGLPDGTESPDIDNPWGFYGNTGMHYSISPTNILSDDGAGNVTLDFSGWGIAWNGISRIDMSTNAWEGNAEGVAIVSCGVDCSAGDSYTLDYSAAIPIGDPSGIGGVRYNLHLEGTISAVPVPAAVWLFGSGLLGLLGFARVRK